MSAGTLRLYEATAALAILEQWLFESEGELTPEIEALLAQAEGDFAKKVEQVALFIRGRLATAAAIKEEEARLAALRKTEENAAERLKAYLLRELTAAGKDKVEGTLAKVRIQKNPPAVKSILTDDDILKLYDERPEYVTLIPAQLKLNSRAALDAWKAGDELPPGLAVEQGTHVRIS